MTNVQSGTNRTIITLADPAWTVGGGGGGAEKVRG